MSRSKHEISHYYLSTTIDLMAADAWMRDHKPPRRGGRPAHSRRLAAPVEAFAERTLP
ncbi:hypothetical protein [Streptomyces silvisoli]|uniref:Integrase n=1 Tax=Streptomyces silvisoli TaxID=3034235 RepID=A0ABT5ZUK9_9ACTN|nr:hypothetical protein [Streptomyces silvisoli]MDF3292703.1 hypothetical protein [Streptomyces silvisoli]